MRHRSAALACLAVLLLAFWPGMLRAAPAPAPSHPGGAAPKETYAILIVGDSLNTQMDAEEKALTRACQEWRQRAHLTQPQLPIISYHMDKPAEKAYCEKVLGIHPDQMLFLGVVVHRHLVARKVRFRVDNVADVQASARRAVEHVMEMLGMDLGPLRAAAAAPTPAPAASAAPASIPSPSPPVKLPQETGVSLLRIATVDYDGTPRTRFSTDDRGVYVNVYLHNSDPSQEQRHLLAVRCLDPQGRPYGRTMGGPFSVAPGESLDAVDMVRRSDPERHNGYLIQGNQIAAEPGTYQILVEVDGQVLGSATFELQTGASERGGKADLMPCLPPASRCAPLSYGSRWRPSSGG